MIKEVIHLKLLKLTTYLTAVKLVIFIIMYSYSSTVTILPFSTLNESFYQYVYLFHSRTNLKEDKI